MTLNCASLPPTSRHAKNTDGSIERNQAQPRAQPTTVPAAPLAPTSEACSTVQTCQGLLDALGHIPEHCGRDPADPQCQHWQADFARITDAKRKVDYDDYVHERAALQRLDPTPAEIRALAQCDAQEWRNHDYYRDETSWLERMRCWRGLLNIELDAFARIRGTCTRENECVLLSNGCGLPSVPTNKRYEIEVQNEASKLLLSIQNKGWLDGRCDGPLLQAVCVGGKCSAALR